MAVESFKLFLDNSSWSLREEHTLRTLSSGNFCDYEQETDYEEPSTDTGVSQTYCRHDQDDNLQSLNRISNHRRQLDFAGF
jgi:hypothetical protein